MKSKRELIVIPILHTLEEMGLSMAGLPEESRKAEARHQVAVWKFWDKIIDFVIRLDLDFSRVKVYEDSLPDDDSGRKLIKYLLELTSGPNHLLRKWLKDKGAQIVGTESRDLLHHRFLTPVQALVNLKLSPSEREALLEKLAKSEREFRENLEKRDNYIAQKIRDTLGEGETGLLFIGAAHNVHQLLAAEVEVVVPQVIVENLRQIREGVRDFGDEIRQAKSSPERK